MFHVVDDEDFVREVVVEMLNEHGYDARSFACPKDYIDFVDSSDFKNPIAVFTDVSMPAMSGYEMINIVSKLKQGLKFVVMTGEPEIQSEYMNKACMYLGKPFSWESFVGVVDSMIRCHAFEPASDHGCTNDQREMFHIEDWSCPHKCNDCPSDSS